MARVGWGVLVWGGVLVCVGQLLELGACALGTRLRPGVCAGQRRPGDQEVQGRVRVPAEEQGEGTEAGS